MQLKNLCSLLAVGSALLGGGVSASDSLRYFKDKIHDRYARRSALAEKTYHSQLEQRADTSKFRYYNNKTEKFFVKSMPDVHFDLGELYSGSIPVGKNDSAKNLFFAFAPTTGDPVDEVTIWLNGGPGCSSLEGFFQENGRFIWQSGTFLPVENPYAWTNLTNMLWVEQPVGTGFSKGPKTATSQEETAADFIKWFKNWQEVFGIKNYKIYVTGESYAGRYVPYISAAMLDQNDTTHYNLSGAMVYDPSIGSGYAQELATAVPLVNANANLFNFNQSFMAELNSLQKSCGYEAYLDEWLVFPAKGVQPTPKEDFGKCNTFEKILDVVGRNNPCFDIYDINAQCPLLWDVLSFPTTLVYTPDGATTYFNRTDVKKALHAPLDVDWEICTEGVLDEDTSPPSIAHAIPQVIEATNRMLIASGDLDMILITNGTLLSIQNMTWHGKTGFQQKPNTPINIQIPDLAWAGVYAENGEPGFDNPQGIMGVQHYERGLMWGETYLSGHMQPEFQPRVTYRHLQWVLGRIDSL